MRLAEQYEALWESSHSAPDVLAFLGETQEGLASEQVQVLLIDQSRRWKSEAPLTVEDYVELLPDLCSDHEVKLKLAVGEFLCRQGSETFPNIEEFTSRFSDLGDQLRSRLSELAPSSQGQHALTGTFGPDNQQLERTKTLSKQSLAEQLAETEHFVDQGPQDLLNVQLDSTEKQSASEQKVGRYQLQRILGEGAFGRVYLAFDGELQRQVAIKVPRKERFKKPEDAEQYLTEARTVASLNHPNIVPVYDTGKTENGSIYVVSKFIEGQTLADRIKRELPGHDESAKLLAVVAQALHHAHELRLVHRDVKPGNILLEGSEATPYVADFGLAIREEDYLNKRSLAGTPAYMSPEQVRGEGHRLDGRSDIFSLGVVLYELLTGKTPFQGATVHDLFHQIITVEPRPPREFDGSVPVELERICQKSLSKRAVDRYDTAAQLADDLLHWNDSEQQETKELQVVPKGLRSFDADDANFFLDLLPGPRSRSGLPESVQFWKTRIEETDPDKTFSVGLIYGPSGCGKSSLVKAGLLPRLSKKVTTVYLEANSQKTEARILRGLRKSLPDLPDGLGLAETCSLLRRTSGGKVVIILDQFEQWLHAKKEEEDTDLVQALRQCDGGRLQCIVMVRDDFWMAATRFMRDLEFRLSEGQNSAAVDLFPIRHAEKVLAAFGRALGTLPVETEQTSEEQHEFLKQSVAGLATEGKVICVRLALFAEMTKAKTWTPRTLQDVGGTTGVGVTFLEETFSASTAPPEHRYHQNAARAVLKALLPESGTDIKGQMKSYDELLEASGYATQLQDFDDLIQILDGGIRLITPTDPAGVEADDDLVPREDADQKYYQLAHDYLVHSLRDWLTRKQRETRRGRAELRLEERSATWNLNPQNRHLPSLWEYANTRLLTNKKDWSEPQQRMMRKAGPILSARWGTALAVFLVIGITIQQYVATIRHQNLVERVGTTVAAMRTSSGPLVPRALSDLRELPDALVVDELKAKFEDSKSLEKLSLAYALAEYGEVDPKFLVSAFATASAAECANFARALDNNRDTALKLLSELSNEADDTGDWRLKGRLAVLALHFDDASLAIDVHAERPDPTQQTVFIHEVFPTLEVDLNRLAKATDAADDARLRGGMCLAMGNLPDEQVGDAKAAWQKLLLRWYQQAPDSGTHGAAGWTLRKWGIALPEIAADATEPEDRDWQVTPMGREFGFTMVRIPKGEFERTDGFSMLKQKATLTNDLWLSDVEVTDGLFQQFVDDEQYHDQNPDLKPEDWDSGRTDFIPTNQHPAERASWEDAILFCNWLSQKEGRLPCYKVERIANPEPLSTGGTQTYMVDGIKVEQKFPQRKPTQTMFVTLLSEGTGYRLPTEAEWEYACRAGTTTDFGFGNDMDLLEHYNLFGQDSPERVGSRMCNRWGLFDMHGSVTELCLDEYGPYSGGQVENPRTLHRDTDTNMRHMRRVMRGGSWTITADSRYCGSGSRSAHSPAHREYAIGFRVAQDQLPSQKSANVAKSESR